MSRSSTRKAAPANPAPDTPAAAPVAATPDPAKGTPQVAPETTGAAVAAAASVDPPMPTGPGASPDPANDPHGNPPSGLHPEPGVPLSFVDPDGKGVEIVILSAVQIDGVDIRSGSAVVTLKAAKDLVNAGAAAFAET